MTHAHVVFLGGFLAVIIVIYPLFIVPCTELPKDFLWEAGKVHHSPHAVDAFYGIVEARNRPRWFENMIKMRSRRFHKRAWATWHQRTGYGENPTPNDSRKSINTLPIFATEPALRPPNSHIWLPQPRPISLAIPPKTDQPPTWLSWPTRNTRVMGLTMPLRHPARVEDKNITLEYKEQRKTATLKVWILSR